MIKNRNGFGNDSHCIFLINGEENVVNDEFSDLSYNNYNITLNGSNSNPSQVNAFGGIFSKTVWEFDFGDDKTGYGSSYLQTENIDMWGEYQYCIDLYLYLDTQDYNDSSTYNTNIFGIYDGSEDYVLLSFDQISSSNSLNYIIKSKNVDEISLTYSSMSISQWYHISLTKYDDEYKMYIDGIEQDSGTTRRSDISYLSNLIIGDATSGAKNNRKIYINEFRISSGNNRWDRNFIEPNRQYGGNRNSIDSEIGAGEYTSFYLEWNIDSELRNYSWGNNIYGELGINSTTCYSTPIIIYGEHKFIKISGGDNHTLAIDENGIGWAWGENVFGELGINSQTSYSTPVAIYGNHTFCEISAGSDHSLAIDNNGDLWSWGSNTNGELGDKTISCRSIPTSVSFVSNICKISAGGGFSLAIDSNGQSWSWGDGTNGKLGNGGTGNKCSPYEVFGPPHDPSTFTFCEISSGYQHSLAIDNNGQSWSWGLNSSGQLGNNSTSSQRTPISVCGNYTFCNISAGGYHSIGLSNNNDAFLWGNNTYGQLGNNSTGNLCQPNIINNYKFHQILAGFNHSLGIDKSGKLWSWGRNTYGQLGDNSVTCRSNPVAVCTP